MLLLCLPESEGWLIKCFIVPWIFEDFVTENNYDHKIQKH